MQIAVKLLGGTPEDAVLRAGEAWGLTGLARSYGYYHDRILQNLRFDELLEAARQSYEAAKSDVATPVFPAIAYAALVPKFLARMERPGFDPIKEKVTYGAVSKQWCLMRAGLRGRI